MDLICQTKEEEIEKKQNKMDYETLKMFKIYYSWMEHKRNGGTLDWNAFCTITRLKN